MWLVITTVTGVIIGAGINAYTIASNIATVPYVNSKHEEGMKYTDMKADQTLQAAIAHSDMNRQAMLIEIREQGANVKAIGAKQDIILEAVQALQHNERRGR